MIKQFGYFLEIVKGSLITTRHFVVNMFFHILNLSGYARLDFRLSESGQPYLIEANPNPQISFGEDFAESAEFAGVSYGRLLQRILNLGLRWHDDHLIE